MISVVVPTMWKFVPFLNFLQDMVACDLISQIIVINNDNQATPEHKILAHAKITLLDYGQNLYVNPSWNLGVYHCKNDIICIANDDLLFDLRVLSKIIKEFLPTHGSVGIQSLGNNTGIMDFFPALGHDLFGFGQLMFIPKNKWIDIPPELNIWYGDNFIFDLMVKNNYINYIIKNLLFYTPHAQTSQHANPGMIQQEIQDYPRVCNSYLMTSYHP